MPELPEVETVANGLRPQLQNHIIASVIIRQRQLRWPIPASLEQDVAQQRVIHITRRGKYLLLQLTNGTLIIHLGMSGTLVMIDPQRQDIEPRKHDHVDFILKDTRILRYRDPRRFGAILWMPNTQLQHPLLQSIGVEPLTEAFTGQYLKKVSIKRQANIKSLIMNSRVVAGVGNIYAAEALFLAKIHPCKPACQLSLTQCEDLVAAIKQVLSAAIAAGGTTLKDFLNSDSKPGYFSQKLYVYGRAKQACLVCNSELQLITLGQRSTVFCGECQQS